MNNTNNSTINNNSNNIVSNPQFPQKESLNNLQEKERKADIKILKNTGSKTKKTTEDTKKPPVNIEDLKNYAEKIKNMNFENVKLKKRKKRYTKKEEEIFEIEKTKTSNHNNPLNLEENKASTNLHTEDFKAKASFNEASSIFQEKNHFQESSYENFDDFLKNLEPNNENPTKESHNFSRKSNNHTERTKGITESFNELLFAKNLLENQSEKRELSLEKSNKYSIQTLDVAREKVRAFKLQLNFLLSNIGIGEINEKTKKDVKSLIQEFATNKYIISQNDRSLLSKLQELVLEEKGEKRCFSANNQKFNIINVANLNLQNAKLKEEVIEENNEDFEYEKDPNKGLKLKNKINPGHFSKVNRNYAENVGKAAQQENTNIGFFNKNRTKSKDKLYADIQ